ncbi:MAG TPA: VOC family protein [Candidatus Dormibacteraeota bacterium]|jgi:catechol-2,3-dioxygenase|nr:VOC family protein [Candidatus Dormibacteraeota bacterium]
MSARIGNVVIESPDPEGLAAFYGAVLGMRVVREDWLVIARDAESTPRLAFDPAADYHRPRWPDPDHPAQVHLDIAVPDAAAADEAVLRLGASRLPDMGDYRSYEDPTGHPFCLYTDTGAEGGPLPGRIGRIVFDCLSPTVLAAFYQGLLGMHLFAGGPRRVTLAGEEGSPMLAFQATQHVPPRWPDPAHPQHLHLDIGVDHGRAAGELATRLGAMPLVPMGGSCPVFADPSGHPFCLCGPGE